MSSATAGSLFSQQTLIASLENKKSPYDALPESIKAVYSEAEWLWLADKHKVLERETDPECE